MTFNAKRIVFWTGSVNEENFSKVVSKIRELMVEYDDERITLIITSSGGNVGVGFAFYDFIKGMKIPLDTVGLGSVDSMAIPMFLAGERRYIGRHTTMYFHETSRSFSKDSSMPFRQQKTVVVVSARWINWYNNIVSGQSSNLLSPDDVEKLMTDETSLGPVEILNLNLAHGYFGK